MNDLKNKTIIITGASKGIGKQLTYSFAKHGSNVILLSRDLNKLQEVSCGIKCKNNQYIKCYKVDISNEKNVYNVFEKIIRENKKIDVLINNAGITLDNLIIRMKSDEWHNVINTNLNGTFYCSKAIIKHMIKEKSGNIINITSVIGQIGNKGQSNYAASKAGIYGLTKSLAKEVGSRNIKVNAINPGYINTEMTENLTNKDEFLKKIPLNRYGDSTDVANLACFLASNKSSYITGQIINVDGGLVM